MYMSDDVKQTSNFNQALWLSIGMLCTYAMTFISAAVLSRYFDKYEYGTYKQIIHIYNTLITLFSAGLPSVFAYFIPRLNVGQQKELIVKLNRIFLLLGLAFSVTLYALSNPLSILLKNKELAVGLKIFSIFPLFTLPTMGVEGIYTAIRKTRKIAIYNLITKTVMLISTIIPVVVFKTGYVGAIIGWGIASFISFVIAMYLKSRPYVKVKQELVPNMYKAIFSYSLPLMGAFIAGFVISSANQFFISRYYGTEVFADFSNGCIGIPFVTMIAASVSNVLLPVFSKADSVGTMDNSIKSYHNAVTKTALLIIPVVVFCFFFAKEIMVFLYGGLYESSTKYFRAFILRNIVCVLPYLSILLALGKSKTYMYIHWVGAAFIWITYTIIVILKIDSVWLVITNSILEIFIPLYAMLYIKRKANLQLIPKSLLKSVILILILSLICGFVVYYSCSFLISNIIPLWRICIGGVSFCVLLFFIGKLFKINYLDLFFSFLKKQI